ncbi:MAG: MarR family transcriptional regulator [Pseudomonadota bacterium]|nr:MarR family transcriptional regulator [Pseudomonadota bacterium]
MPGQKIDVRELALAVFAVSGQLIETGNALVAPLGLTSAWWQVLGALRYSPAPLPTASIARNMGLTRQAVQRSVDILADRGLVEFRPNPHHRRAKLVVLTEAGQEAVSRAEQAAGPIDQAIVDRIGSQQIREAVATLQAVSAVLAEELEVSPQRSSGEHYPQKETNQ